MTTNNFKPILFSTEMVQAILAGRKTQTRRVMKPELLSGPAAHPLVLHEKNLKEYINVGIKKNAFDFLSIKPGDILWVRETFQKLESVKHKEIDFLYKADVEYHNYFNSDLVVWSPSIHMPKEAARIFLKVTNVRAERLQDISHNDALLEGIIGRIGGAPPYDYSFQAPKTPNLFQTPQQAYRFLWQSINAKKHPWDSNPWVWVYEFERIEKPENFLP